jgi:hypothetical protein
MGLRGIGYKEWETDRTGLGSCPVKGFGIKDVEFLRYGTDD